MKPTFGRLSPDKRESVMRACISEFAEHGYEGGSTDRICRMCGISKGGLYEYTGSKEELFLYAVETAYGELYGYIREALAKRRRKPADILERFMRVSEIAIDFYLAHPDCIRLIQKAALVVDPALRDRVHAVFDAEFMSVFGDLDGSQLRFAKSKIVDLIAWLLLKTRDDFLAALQAGRPAVAVKRAYLTEWRFYLDILKSGIYADRADGGRGDPPGGSAQKRLA
jgi:AcrR family transcriptional regulator